jgi:hypothetical protein
MITAGGSACSRGASNRGKFGCSICISAMTWMNTIRSSTLQGNERVSERPFARAGAAANQVVGRGADFDVVVHIV